MMMPDCQCPAAGYCETLKRHMNERTHAICRRESPTLTAEQCDVYRRNWWHLATNEPLPVVLTPAERQELTQGLDDDSTLFGNRIAEFTKLFGVPTCGGCEARRQWINKAHAWLRGTLPAPPPVRPVFISTAQAAEDALRLVHQLPSDVSGIIGVARSGLFPASLIAMHLHLPLWILRQDLKDIVPAGHGWRLASSKKRGRMLVVDDTVMTGTSLLKSRAIVENHLEAPPLWAVLYRNPTASRKAVCDFFARELTEPHFLEWNLFNSSYLPQMAFDFDGVLCNDGVPLPRYLPRKQPIPLIVTGRPESERQASLDWLAHWGLKVKKLIMWPHSLEARNEPGAVSRYKAEHFLQSGLAYFVESCPRQAAEIAALAQKPVVCPAARKVFCH